VLAQYMLWLSVRLFVYPSVRPSQIGVLPKWLKPKRSITKTALYDSQRL